VEEAGDVEVEAAGGVVLRTGADGTLEVLLVHRPRYDDWSFPKGKLHPGEDHRTAAAREVLEETGFRCRIDRELGELRYLDRHGRAKRVRYWSMQPVAGRFAANGEVDRVGWFPLDDARRTLTYERDASLLDAAAGPSG
jgi:8-oxo-dGTP diphosphatase